MQEFTMPLYRYVLRYRRPAAFGFFSVAMAIALTMYIPQVLGDIVDGLKTGLLSESDLFRLIGQFLAVSLLGSLFSIFMRRILLGWLSGWSLTSGAMCLPT
jgi:ABC-type multidrug transport system fused ATPase/permease subunit